jgi:4-amino-4-deoxy-L-arabinose transferase-like glycosyltransferase
MIFLQAASIWLLGRNTVTLRLPSVFLDLGLIFLLYFPARHFLDWRVALIVAFLMAVSSWDIT